MFPTIHHVCLELQSNFRLCSSEAGYTSSSCRPEEHINGLVQERRNSSALAVELRLSYTNPWYRLVLKLLSNTKGAVAAWSSFRADIENWVLKLFFAEQILLPFCLHFMNTRTGVKASHDLCWTHACLTSCVCSYAPCMNDHTLTHQGWDKMAHIPQIKLASNDFAYFSRLFLYFNVIRCATSL